MTRENVYIDGKQVLNATQIQGRDITDSIPLNNQTLTWDESASEFVFNQVSIVNWYDAVKDKDLTEPPGSPSDGDRYIIGTSASGAWAGEDDNITEYDGATWNTTTMSGSEGQAVWVEDEDVIYIYNGSSWVKLGTLTDHGNLLGLADDDHTQYLLVNGTRAMSNDLDMDSYSVDNINVASLKAISCIVHNATGATLTAGTCVYPNGMSGGTVTVDKCDNTDSAKMPCLGVVSIGITNGNTGKAVTCGIKSMDTSGFSGLVGDRIYTQSDGSINTTVPTSGSIQRLGILVVKAVSGQIYIHSRGRKATSAAANEHPEIRMGNDAGHQKICFLDYTNNEVGCIDNNGNLTLSGTINAGEVNFSGNVSIGGKITETVKAHGVVTSGTETYNLNDGSYHTTTVSGNYTAAFSNWSATDVTSLTMKLTNAGGHTITWDGAVVWSAGVEPSWTTTGVDFAVFLSDDNGTTIYGDRSLIDMR